MALALIMSSFVAASRIGGAAQQYVLAAHKIDPVLAPTVMFGRSPAKGGEGQVTSPEVFRRMLGDIEADALFGMLDLVITGHFSAPEQVEIAAGVLERVRDGAERAPVVIVDPILGDAPKGLYVKPAVAKAIETRLVPIADWITPNLWELSMLSGVEATDATGAARAVRRLGRPALVTSVPAREGEIGILLCDADEAVLFAHERLDSAPNGTGDLVAASFGAGLVEGLEPRRAAERAARTAAETVQACREWNAPELPLVALADRLVSPTAQVRIERLGGGRTAAAFRIEGRVQGVGFRWWALGEAERRGLAGWVRNRRDGAVELLAIGEPAAIADFARALNEGPPGARVASVIREDAQDDGATGFEQRPTV